MQGLDTPTPFLQLSGTMLMGQHVSLLGTELLFSEAPAAGTSAGVTQGESPLAAHQPFAAPARVHLCKERTTVANLARADDNNDPPHERAPQGKKPLVHVANTEHRIRFKEVELKPKIPGAPSDGNGGSATPTAKTSNLAKKVNTQMEHVISGSGGGAAGGSSRRGRGRGRGGGRKRGATDGRSKTASSRSKPRGSSDQEGDDDAVEAELAEGEDVERGDADAVDESASASASVRMDTSA